MQEYKNKLKKVIAIIGPTGSGKTSWAKALAKKFNGKVISVDSRQIYKGMDIGTAKDKTFPQDLIDIVNPDESYTVSDYQKAATELINGYLKVKSLPILVGGTGLYMESVLYGFVLPELKEQSEKLREDLGKLTDVELYKKLQEIDFEASKKIDPRNKRRVIRALEVTILSGKPFSAQQKKLKPKFDSLIIGIKTDRETLYSKIDARVDQMIKEGLVEEVRKLADKYRKDLPAFNTIGYKEIFEYISANEIPRQSQLGHISATEIPRQDNLGYLSGKQTLKEAIEKIKNNTHAYVRRQDTWFNRDKNIHWVDDLSQAEKLIEKFLKK
ncbi:TPA: tRNA (adenosine(37)-N6)-dimethylallyltransferase MiaA [Candidatus Berkelbacteria bacterium]|uniref:tRNA dimethylallyltransferase n=1 Tax=Berkelbacteria bacterium GW2011_GWE1_39_12 TaxID=1618337 RepID=A0A0G4B4C6_9BACT|nr:MAG: tRNA delta(2)-isopentenylpyrophosphate transferase, tRNA dimethylallyltransferase [Berkelbacteria bacterium GW2011_GWE1_39_12]HBO61052.1 tRNA (adenosine(37)-N6)-dimethylallyltransferase MiaA [Candidatus Berkelbacteria bacterium]